MQNQKIYVLLRNGLIEDYYDVQSFVGIFSSIEDIEHYFEVRKAKHEAALLDEFIKYKLDAGQKNLADSSAVVERLESNLINKIPGSNGHKKALWSLETARAALAAAKAFKLLSWEEWYALRPKYNLSRNQYEKSRKHI